MKLIPAFSRLWLFLPLVLLTLLSFRSGIPAQGTWELLGTRLVNYGLDRDEIMVTAAEGQFTALKFKVKRGPMNLHKVVVHFGNGESQEIETRHQLKAGGETRVIDLPGNTRIIKKVVFWYDTKNMANRKAVLALLGRH